MTWLHSIDEVVAATGGGARGVTAEGVSSISIDSRDISPGALFVAIAGENFDGHDFVAKAIEAGAVAALVSRDRAGALAGLPLIVVDDAFEGLRGLARFARQRSTARIVAVTGSVGKTSTKEAIRAALSASGTTHAAIKSFNNHWGVPLMLARMPADAQFGVFEIGMSNAGEITPLVKMVRPHVAVITNVGPVHLESFPSVEAIADAKAEIFAGVEPRGLAILGRDHDHSGRLIEAADKLGLSVLTYGVDESADVRIIDYKATETGGIAHIRGDELDSDVETGAQGQHGLLNAVAALLASRALGGDVNRALAALKVNGAAEGRGAVAMLGQSDNPLRLIDESYNANPIAMRAALDNFAHVPNGLGRKIIVLGDMRELGPQSAQFHRDLADPVLASGADMVFLVGRDMAMLAEKLPPKLVAGWSQTVDEIAPEVLQSLAPGDSVMLKASNSVRLGSLVARIRDRFDA